MRRSRRRADILYPDGVRMDCCLPRESLPGGYADPLGDRIDVIPRNDWGDLIGQVERSSDVKHIYSQGRVGSCATESTSQALAVVRVASGLDPVVYNPWSIYWKTSGGRDRGSSIDANLRYARDVGILPADVWPRSRGWSTKPPDDLLNTVAINNRIDEFYDVQTLDELGTALLLGWPVVFGWSGHSCVFTELLSRSEAVYANSWGASWNGNGFGRLALSRINWGYGCWAVRTSTEQDARRVDPAYANAT